MDRSNFQVGQKVYFGRRNGEKTLGEVVKLNPAKAKVRQLEDRGSIRDYPVGTVWTVPYNLMKPADPTAAAPTNTPATPKPSRQPIAYSPFSEDNQLLSALLSVYVALSPENLHCDGEASPSHVRSRRATLERRLKGIHIALGYEPSEGELYDWERQRNEYQRQRQQRQAN